MTTHAPETAGTLVCDFGRGSREQSQGIRRKDDVPPILRLVETSPPRD